MKTLNQSSPISKSVRKPLSRVALLGLVLGGCGVAGFAASAVGYRFGWWSAVTALKIAQWAVVGAGLGCVLSLIGASPSRPDARRRGLAPSILGLVVSLPVVAMAIQWEYATRAYPPINDISTDIEDPPVFWSMPIPTIYPGGETAKLQRAAYPDLIPLNLSVAPGRVHALVKALARDRGWEIVADEPEEGRIEAVASTFIYGFKDEIVVRVSPSNGGAQIDVRSRSRIGRIDRGANARRIRAFFADLRKNASSEQR